MTAAIVPLTKPPLDRETLQVNEGEKYWMQYHHSLGQKRYAGMGMVKSSPALGATGTHTTPVMGKSPNYSSDGTNGDCLTVKQPRVFALALGSPRCGLWCTRSCGRRVE